MSGYHHVHEIILQQTMVEARRRSRWTARKLKKKKKKKVIRCTVTGINFVGNIRQQIVPTTNHHVRSRMDEENKREGQHVGLSAAINNAWLSGRLSPEIDSWANHDEKAHHELSQILVYEALWFRTNLGVAQKKKKKLPSFCASCPTSFHKLMDLRNKHTKIYER